MPLTDQDVQYREAAGCSDPQREKTLPALIHHLGYMGNYAEDLAAQLRNIADRMQLEPEPPAAQPLQKATAERSSSGYAEEVADATERLSRELDRIRAQVSRLEQHL